MQGVPVIRSTAEIPPNGYHCKEQLILCMHVPVCICLVAYHNFSILHKHANTQVAISCGNRNYAMLKPEVSPIVYILIRRHKNLEAILGSAHMSLI